MIKQLLYCSSNVDLGQGRRQDFLWERGVSLFQAKMRAGKKKIACKRILQLW